MRWQAQACVGRHRYERGRGLPPGSPVPRSAGGQDLKKKTVTSRQLQAIKTKRRLFQSAVKLMDDYGYDNVTIEDISSKAGVSVGTFYHYYSAKSDVIVEIYAQIDDYFKTDVEPLLTHADAFDNIRVFLRHYAAFNAERGYGHIRLLFETHSRLFVDKSRHMYVLFRRIVEEGQSAGQITHRHSAEYIADYMLVLVRGVLYTWILNEGSYNIEACLLDYLDTLAPAFRA
ncbi:MAG: TetR/AcrR family transcriptional regulator [Clostridiales Family XIII bacterium]|nr:TetR/AcrR family transcriptional regulator [Clostridiales Family XIII bacterium]